MREAISILVLVVAMIFISMTPTDKAQWDACRQNHSALHCLKKFAE
ncbi:hypothetical protein [Ralstonia mannitolilytica]|nr:hypothetical protein [Ralstonia mannitolilytica]